jgi:16S rRNA (uracil1498-N3)-methyltransferase
MSRRFIVEQVSVGRVALDARQSRHARDVLRLAIGETVEVFDAAGGRAEGRIVSTDPHVQIEIASVARATSRSREIVIASAVPKGDRADWLVEKLSELNVTRWIPVRTARSVVHPEGTSKFDRWRRIADESAKQCGRDGVMKIEPLQAFEQVLSSHCDSGFVGMIASLSVDACRPAVGAGVSTIVLVGPEGGWTDEELAQARDAGWASVTLGSTILRIETAAVVAAAIISQEIYEV